MPSSPLVLPGSVTVLPLAHCPRTIKLSCEMKVARRLKFAGLPVFYESHQLSAQVQSNDGRLYEIITTPDFMLPATNHWLALELKSNHIDRFVLAKYSLLWAAFAGQTPRLDLALMICNPDAPRLYTSLGHETACRFLYFLGFSVRAINRWTIGSVTELLRPVGWSLEIIRERLQPLAA